MKKVLIIYNPVSGWWPSRSLLFELISRLAQKNYLAEVYITQKDKSTQSVIGQFRENEPDLIICCGGDGTLHETINGILKFGIKTSLGYIPIGTTNDFGSTHGIPNDFDAAYDLIENGETKAYDVGLFNKDEYFTYIACFGLFTRLTYEASQPLKNILGYLAYYIEGAKDLVQLQKSYHLRVETDEDVYEGDFIFGAVVNSFNFAGIFQVPITAEQLSDGYMEVVLVKAPEKLIEYPTVAESMIRSNYQDTDKLIYCKTKRVHFISDEPIAWNIDGEYGGTHNEVTIEVQNEKLKIIL